MHHVTVALFTKHSTVNVISTISWLKLNGLIPHRLSRISPMTMQAVLLVVVTSCVLLTASAETSQSESGLRIGAFNVQVFGASKAGKPEVMSTLAQIIQRYDILLIQEIRDVKQKAIYKLLQQTNDLGPAQYDMKLSERLGRTSSKEQYAFLYRNSTDAVKVLATYQYPDSSDKFEREPFAVRFKAKNALVPEFILAGVHIDPDVAVEEIDSLAHVHEAIVNQWGSDNIAILGDLNADCSYVSKTRLGKLVLRNDAKYTWLIGDDVDTTTKATHCAYDRIIVTGSVLTESAVSGSAQVYRFDTDFKLSEDQTTAVSDHFPIEFILKTEESSTANKDEEGPTSSAPTIHPIMGLYSKFLAWLQYDLDHEHLVDWIWL